MRPARTNAPILASARTLTPEAQDFLKNSAGRHYIALEDHDDGTMVYNKTADESELHSETVLLHVENCEIRILFADENGTVNGVEVFFIKPGKNIFDPLTFNESIPFKDAYKRIYISYAIRWLGV